MSGRKSRSKGQCGELECRNLIRTYGFQAERGRSQSAGGGEEDPDVRSSIPGVHIEVKRQESVPLTVYKWMQQAMDDSGSRIPVVFMRRNRQEWLVVLRAEDWLEREKHAHE